MEKIILLLVPLSFAFKRMRDFFALPKKVSDLTDNVNFLGVTLSKVVSHLSGKDAMDSFSFGGMKSDLDKRFDAVGAASPLQLTGVGEELLHESGLQKILDSHKDELIGLLDDALKGNTNRYDMQKMSFSVIDNFLADNAKLGGMIKEYAFDKGTSDLSEFVRAGGIYLRNLYFADKGFSLEKKKHPQPQPHTA